MSTHLSETRFADLALPESLQKALQQQNFEYCTPIQAQSLPLLLEGRDCAGQAQTGTGKTLAFLLAACTRLLQQPGNTKAGFPRSLILAPTRELALQIHKDAVPLCEHSGLKLALAYGGKDYEKQKSQFEGPVDILIGTPGRLIDFLKQRLYNLKHAEVMVLDEADRMFDMGFIKDVRYLLRRLPEADQRLNMLFSATMAQKVMELAYEHMNNAELVKVASDSPAVERIEQVVYHPANEEKIPLLIGLMQTLKPERSIVFTNTKHAAIRIWEFLEGNALPAAIISGDIHQSKREKLLKKFHDGEFHILVATDVASRGLHIPDVTHVFNYDLPDIGEDYVHRIGRTARAGKDGHAISFACEEYAMNLMDIESYIGRQLESARISSEILAEVAPRIRMQRDKPPQGKPRNRGNGRSGQHDNRSKSGQRKPRRARTSAAPSSGPNKTSGNGHAG